MLPRRFLVKPLRRGAPPTLLGFLASHFEHGQLEQYSYDALCEVVLSINRLSKVLFSEPCTDDGTKRDKDSDEHGESQDDVDAPQVDGGHQAPAAELNLSFAFDAIAQLESGACLASFSQHDLIKLPNRTVEAATATAATAASATGFRAERIANEAAYIEDICEQFGEHGLMRCERVEEATRVLPELSGVLSDEAVYERISVWADILFFLHEPNENDTVMYRNFLIYFDQFVHAPYMQSCRDAPETRSDSVKESLKIIRWIFEDLTFMCEFANKAVRKLRLEYSYALDVHNSLLQNMPPPQSPLQMPVVREADEKPTMEQMIQALEELDAFFDADDEATFSPPQSTKSSFTDSTYAAVTARSRNPSFRSVEQPTPRHPSATIPRTVSRVFTGSFEDLERGVTDLELHRTPSGNPIEPKVRDFAPPPTPCMLPSPRTLLARSEAFRLVEGQMPRRRMAEKGRALTVDERSLSGWLGVEGMGLQRPVSAAERGRKSTM
ncbi:hypothetical protein B0A48_06182 [Cryoendolithus antarcticus]|uniref:Uncharacterized protein n=1 Tax=Cryoendolithus antarcticus TaxID=1507870 RepID=A0A1V8TAV8_9PEZI|nr:hypothetical protein B0A48_06182 [Cryoendolithus antarcticus]